MCHQQVYCDRLLVWKEKIKITSSQGARETVYFKTRLKYGSYVETLHKMRTKYYKYIFIPTCIALREKSRDTVSNTVVLYEVPLSYSKILLIFQIHVILKLIPILTINSS